MMTTAQLSQGYKPQEHPQVFVGYTAPSTNCMLECSVSAQYFVTYHTALRHFRPMSVLRNGIERQNYSTTLWRTVALLPYSIAQDRHWRKMAKCSVVGHEVLGSDGATKHAKQQMLCDADMLWTMMMVMTHLHGTDHLDLSHIPQLCFAIVGADRQVGPPLAPRHRAHAVLGLAAAEVTQLGDLAGAGGPQVHTGAQAHCQHILS